MNVKKLAISTIKGFFCTQLIPSSLKRCLTCFIGASMLLFVGNAYAVITVGLSIDNDLDSNGNITVINGSKVKVSYAVIEDTDKDLHKNDVIQLLRVSDDRVVDSVKRGKKKNGSAVLKVKNSVDEALNQDIAPRGPGFYRLVIHRQGQRCRPDDRLECTWYWCCFGIRWRISRH